MEKDSFNNDEIISVDGIGDYTIKIFQKEDCKYYATVVLETDDDSKMVFRTKPKKYQHEAATDARAWIAKH